ncbi:FAD-linked oxidase C-terminal domain-containing protein [Pseudogemmobacter sonorensis]|uniref:FAD-linked oxidase C-terminal domain-containing protein n=1 Tax=Pseudogemmobacter sonorensis TaxID=2989681 RepID=UPI0036AA0245
MASLPSETSAALQALLGDRFSPRQTDHDHHAGNETHHAPQQAVVWAPDHRGGGRGGADLHRGQGAGRSGRDQCRLVEKALSVEGTCAGQHGVGLGKRKYLVAKHGPALAVMRRIKSALDPEDLFNPGRILP